MTRRLDEPRVAYSERIPVVGDVDTWAIQMDLYAGFLGVTQYKDGATDRVLLAPHQVEALIAFYHRRRSA